MTKATSLAALALALLTPALYAQLPTMSDVDRSTASQAVAGPLPEWDVALLKPHPPADTMMSWRMTDDGLSLINLSLEQLIENAWDMKPYQIAGLTGWTQDTSFDLTAKVSAADVAAYKKLSRAQRRQMLQKLLVDRFHLKVHTEMKTLPTYDLVIDKGGAKLQGSTAIAPPSPEERKLHPDQYKKGNMTFGPGTFDGTGVAVASLASQLANAVERPVNDKTGLTGAYDIKLHYRAEDSPQTAGDDASLPSVFSAVQEELGLKLIATKGPVETLVVDTAAKPDAD